MPGLSAVLFTALLLILIGQRIQYKRLQQEINYISHRLESLSIDSENGFVLLPTDNACMKRLGADINTLLHGFYKRKTTFEQAQKDMAQLLTNISHDIRTPLTVLKGYIEMLTAEAGGLSAPEKIHMMIANIDRKADDLTAAINDYFTLSKIISDDFPLNPQKENISSLCRDTILDYYDLLEQRHFETDIQIPDEQVYINTDRDALQRILKNLIDNAIRHGGDGKYIALRLMTEKDKIIIEVEDHGKGIPLRQQKQIFIRNYTTAPKSSGSGLGLAIVKNLASKLDAELQVHSIEHEKTVFRIMM